MDHAELRREALGEALGQLFLHGDERLLVGLEGLLEALEEVGQVRPLGGHGELVEYVLDLFGELFVLCPQNAPKAGANAKLASETTSRAYG